MLGWGVALTGDEKAKLEKLIALTFDSDPEVRKKAAMELAKVDDAGAMLALIELSYDKDEAVADLAQKILNKRRGMKPKMLPLNELFEGVSFAAEKKKEKKASTVNPKVLDPIKKVLLKKFKDEKKAERALNRIVDQLKEMKNEKPLTTQEFITAYVEVMGHVNEDTPPAVEAIEKELAETSVQSKSDEQPHDFKPAVEVAILEKREEFDELALVGSARSAPKPEALAQELEEVNRDDIYTAEEKAVVDTAAQLPKTVFKMAYDQFMALDGDEKLMKKQADLLEKYVKKQIELAHKIAKKKFKEIKLTDISAIKHGMANITTEPLEVVSVDFMKYYEGKRVKKEKLATRVVVRDSQGKEGVLYLFEGRGKFLQPGMKFAWRRQRRSTSRSSTKPL